MTHFPWPEGGFPLYMCLHMYEARDGEIIPRFLTKSKLKNLGSVMETDRGEPEIWMNYPSYFTKEIKSC